jgi:hypothetical protein
VEVHFTPEQEAKLAQLANTAGTDAKSLVKDAALRLLEEVPTSALLFAKGLPKPTKADS